MHSVASAKASGGGVPPMCGDMLLLPATKFLSNPFLGSITVCRNRSKHPVSKTRKEKILWLLNTRNVLQFPLFARLKNCKPLSLCLSTVMIPGELLQSCEIFCIQRKGLDSSVEASSQREICQKYNSKYAGKRCKVLKCIKTY